MLNILFVDDEPNVLSGLKRLLRPMHKQWNMVFCESAELALEELKNQQFEVIVSDIRMPGINGVQLLNQVKNEQPEIIRLALSGDASSEIELECAQAAHQFIAKPSASETLQSAIDRAINIRKIISDNRLQAMVGSIDSLPSLPDLYQRMLNEMTDKNGSIVSIGKIISEDMAISAKTLQLVNSAFFGIPQRVDSVSQAVSLLGIDTIKAIVVSQKMFNRYENKDLGGLNLSLLAFNGNVVGSLAKMIAKHLGQSKKFCGDVMMAGFLHNIGKLVLACGFPERYKIVNKTISKGSTFREAELAEFDVSHESIGGYLLGIWGLPNPIVEAVTYHHSPSSAEIREFSVLSCVYLGVSLIHALECDLSRSELEDYLDMDYVSNFYSKEQLTKCIELSNQFGEEVSKA